MKSVACFFTGGYTESNSMQIFLKKINENIELKQFCPNRTKKRKRPGFERDLIDKYSGLTGDALLHCVYVYLTNHKEEFSDFDAIIIEDDLDGLFKEELVPGDKTTLVSKRTQSFEDHCKTISKTVREKLNKDETFPVIQFYAAPEIETWFLSDWNNSFGSVYGPKGMALLTSAENAYFSARFHPYIRDHILCQYNDCFENYGYFAGTYRKLSDEIISSFDLFKVAIAEEALPIAKTLSIKEELRYSKRIHGDAMLRQISPDTVRTKCTVYFQEAFSLLKGL